MEIGKAIAFVRGWRGLSQNQLAKTAGVSVSNVNMIERGLRYPSIDTLEKIAGALNTRTSNLVRLAEDDGECEKFINGG